MPSLCMQPLRVLLCTTHLPLHRGGRTGGTAEVVGGLFPCVCNPSVKRIAFDTSPLVKGRQNGWQPQAGGRIVSLYMKSFRLPHGF